MAFSFRHLTSSTLTFEGSIPSRATVGNWFGEFRTGRQSLEEKPRAGHLHTAVMDGNVAAVRKLLIEDPHITFIK